MHFPLDRVLEMGPFPMIPAEVIADIRARNELVAFIQSAGVQLRRRGARRRGFCPKAVERGIQGSGRQAGRRGSAIAGVAAAIAEKLRPRGIDVRTIVLPAKDPNELLVIDRSSSV
ncbi:MAG: hypothetical protein AB1714_20955 [Acidobacteriota bacterium]